MKPVVVLAVIIGSSFAAPLESEELLRTKKSYGAPCAGVAPYAPVALYLSQAPQPHYREEEHIEEQQARSNYESSLGGLSGYSGASSGAISSSSYGSGLHSLGGAGLSLSGGAAYGPAVGLFPNANVGGCNIPLLLSCAPNVVTGHLAQSHGYSGYSAPAYRNEEEPKEEWAKMARIASHHKISEDFPDPEPGAATGHYIVSQDFPKPNVTHVSAQPLVEKPTL